MSCKVSFIGLGVMGYPMAGYISKAGHNVTVYNRTKYKAEKWIKEYKGKIAETPEGAAKESDFVFTCVGNDDDLKEVAIGKKGIFNTIKKCFFCCHLIHVFVLITITHYSGWYQLLQ